MTLLNELHGMTLELIFENFNLLLLLLSSRLQHLRFPKSQLANKITTENDCWADF